MNKYKSMYFSSFLWSPENLNNAMQLVSSYLFITAASKLKK